MVRGYWSSFIIVYGEGLRETRARNLGINMKNEFTAIIEQDGAWYIGYCPEIPGANGQGRTVEECRVNLGEAIALILEDRVKTVCAVCRRMRYGKRLSCNETQLVVAAPA